MVPLTTWQPVVVTLSPVYWSLTAVGKSMVMPPRALTMPEKPGKSDRHVVVDRDAEVLLDGLDEQVGPGVVGRVDAVHARDARCRSPGMSTQRSRGMESTVTVLVAGSKRATMVTSLRWPPALASSPKALTWVELSTKARESEPTSSRLKGLPGRRSARPGAWSGPS